MVKKRNNTTQKSQRAAKKKAVYRIKNWAAYNASLVQRSSLTVWVSDEMLESWHPEPEGPRQRGGQVRYSDRAIEFMLL